MIKVFKKVQLAIVALCILSSCNRENYLSPGSMAVDSDGGFMYVALTTASKVGVVNLGDKSVEFIKLEQNPNFVKVDNRKLYVACGEEKGCVEVYSLPERKLIQTIKTGHTPSSIVISDSGEKLYVANRFSGNISVIDLPIGDLIKNIKVVREPKSMALSCEGKLVVANFLPNYRATDNNIAC